MPCAMCDAYLVVVLLPLVALRLKLLAVALTLLARLPADASSTWGSIGAMVGVALAACHKRCAVPSVVEW